MKYLILIPIFVTMCVAQVIPDAGATYKMVNLDTLEARTNGGFYGKDGTVKSRFGLECRVMNDGLFRWINLMGDSVLVRLEDDPYEFWSSGTSDSYCICPDGALFLVSKKWWDSRITAGIKRNQELRARYEKDSIEYVTKQKSDEILKEKIRKILEKTK